MAEMYALAPAVLEMTADPGLYAQVATRATSAESGSPWWQRLFAALGTRPSWRVLAPVTVVAVLALAILWPSEEPASRFAELAAVETLPWVQIDVRGGSGDELKEAFSTGMQAYRDQDFTTAAKKLDVVTTLMTDARETGREFPPGFSDQAQLYRGISHLLAGDVAESLVPLSEARGSALRPVAERATWAEAQALLLLDRPREALTGLETLSDSPVYGSRSIELMARIRSLLDS